MMNDPSVCKAFDLMHPRMELSSGAQRVHQHDLLVGQIRKKGLDPESFEFYLRPFRFGMPPHAGWGLGADRLVMTMLGLSNVREAGTCSRVTCTGWFPDHILFLSPQSIRLYD